MPRNIADQISQRIRDARRRRPHMTDQHVADFLQITLLQLERIRDGEERPTADQIVLLADLMDVPPSWFFNDV